jgi:hypothetical protein
MVPHAWEPEGVFSVKMIERDFGTKASKASAERAETEERNVQPEESVLPNSQRAVGSLSFSGFWGCFQLHPTKLICAKAALHSFVEVRGNEELRYLTGYFQVTAERQTEE